MARYEITTKSAMQWAAHELEHVGRIASLVDKDIQYAYAMSTLNGMAHLKDALYELVTDPEYSDHVKDLQKTHDAVVRTMRHLRTTYNLDLDAIRAFNTRGTLSDLSYLDETNNSNATNVSNNNSNATNVSNNSQPNYAPNMAANYGAEDGEYASTNRVSQNGGRSRRRGNRKLKHRRSQRRRV